MLTPLTSVWTVSNLSLHSLIPTCSLSSFKIPKMPPRVNHELSRMLNATITAYYNIPPEGRNKAEVLGAFGKDSSIDEELAKLATKMLPNVNRVQLETIKERVQSYQAFVDANHSDQSELSCQYPKALSQSKFPYDT